MKIRRKKQLSRSHVLCWWVVFAACIQLSGCATNYLMERDNPLNPLGDVLNLTGRGGPQPTDRSSQALRRFDLSTKWGRDKDATLHALHDQIEKEPNYDLLYTYAELSYLRGVEVGEKKRDLAKALNLYGSAVTHSYYYLFDPYYQVERNIYDPQFRRACDVYNAALEGALRIVHSQGKLKPGARQMIQVGDREIPFQVVIRGPWRAEEIERLEFVSDYDVNGLNNRYKSYGLGVPLIAVRKADERSEPAAHYYPPGLSFPMTAFLRVHHQHAEGEREDQPICTLELHEPLSSSSIRVAGYDVPLEMDASTPLAYFLENPGFQESKSIATWGLLAPNRAEKFQGIYMLEAYDPHKIPVLLVHGLWSSPNTWTQMYNDLRSLPEVRNNYQFWTYLYPTGQPFWISAAQLRGDLAEMRKRLDPQSQSRALNQMVLVGHSMGGLVSRLQTVDSGEQFWSIISDQPFDELEAEPETREKIANTLFFAANPSIRRVVTLGTPHRGSDFANDYTRYIGRHLITLPKMIRLTTNRLVQNNPGFFRDPGMLTMSTSIDSLAPESPMLPVLLNAAKPAWVKYHNVVGVVGKKGIVGKLAAGSDGIVDYNSAHLDDVQSEIVVQADHVTVHQHPRSILEVRRVLLEHLGQAVAEWSQGMQTLPAGYQQTNGAPAVGLPAVDPSGLPSTSLERLPVGNAPWAPHVNPSSLQGPDSTHVPLRIPFAQENTVSGNAAVVAEPGVMP